MKARSLARSALKPTPETAEAWRTFLSEVAARRHELLRELEVNGGRRRELACAAAAGQDDALKAAAAFAERSDSIQHELALLQIAEERAQAELGKLALHEAAKSRAEAVEGQQRRLAARSRLAGVIEDRLRELAGDLRDLDRLGQEASTTYFMLGGERLIVAPLDRSAIGSRLSEFCFGLGLEQWLPVACAATKTPPNSFRQIECDAQAAYQILQ